MVRSLGTDCVSPQIVYLDFDVDVAQYNNSVLGIDSEVIVENAGLNAGRIAVITSKLNTLYNSRNVLFCSEQPVAGEYSTVYIGKSAEFERFGDFTDIAENIDYGNQIKDDEAFVNLQYSFRFDNRCR